MMLYRLQFLLKNPIDQEGSISLLFSNSFNMDGTSITEIEYGLSDISRSQTAKMTYNINTKTLLITSFAKFSPVLISLLLEINNPSSPGPTNPIIISSYLSDGTLVDQDSSLAYVTISIYSSPTDAFITYPGATSSQATGSSTIIGVNFSPQVEIPALGYVKIIVPSGFDILSAPICKLQPTNMLLQASPSCSFLDGLLTVQLYADVGNNLGKFVTTVSSLIQINNIIAPETSGWYIFDFSTYSAVWDFLESGQATAILTASIFSSYNFDVVSGGAGSLTILIITFTTSKLIPTGNIPYITTELQGGIEVLLPTKDSLGNLLFPLDLGLGIAQGDTIPCKGISGIQSVLLCKVVYVPASAAYNENIIVEIWNFAGIPSGTNIVIHIPGIHYVSSLFSPTITVTTYQNYNRIRSDLETGQSPLVAGSAVPGQTNTGIGLLLSTTLVNATSILSLSSNLPLASATVSNFPFIIVQINPTHEKGYCEYGLPECFVNSIEYPCTCYPQADIVLVSLTANILAPYSLSISKLVNPETVSITNDLLSIYVIDSYQVIQIYSFSGGLPLITSGTILNPYVTVSERGKNYVNTIYIFQLTPQHYMINGGYLTLNFGKEYSLDKSVPSSSCFTKYLTGSINCTISSNTITVTGYNTNINIFLLYVVGVKNPQIPFSSPFQCIVYSSSGLIIDAHYSIPGITFVGQWATQNLEYVTITNNPRNANATSEYSIGITPSKYLGNGGIIEIVFPSANFNILPNPPNCRLAGYVSTMRLCETFNNKIKITLNQAPPYKILYIDVIGILNFPEGTSDFFTINTIYDGVLLQTNFDPVVVSTLAQVNVLSVKSLSFYPQNEGEIATYSFKIVPQFNVLDSAVFTIKFPVEYDLRLGTSFSCYSQGLSGNLICKSFTAYTITVYNHNGYSVCLTCSITLYVYGIINPTYHSDSPITGQFSIGIYSNNIYQELNENSGECTILPAGDYLDIELIKHDNLYSRNTGIMSFNITVYQAIPPTSDEGAL